MTAVVTYIANKEVETGRKLADVVGAEEPYRTGEQTNSRNMKVR